MGTKTNKLCFVIADDNKTDHFFIKNAITEQLNEVDVVSLYDGQELVNYIKNCNGNYPDCALVDINMPKGGFEALEELREDPCFKYTSFYILTASNSQADLLRSFDLCAKGYFTKPTDTKKLRKIIRKIISKLPTGARKNC
jgi:CheY-like chemotaxis protein